MKALAYTLIIIPGRVLDSALFCIVFELGKETFEIKSGGRGKETKARRNRGSVGVSPSRCLSYRFRILYVGIDHHATFKARRFVLEGKMREVHPRPGCVVNSEVWFVRSKHGPYLTFGPRLDFPTMPQTSPHEAREDQMKRSQKQQFELAQLQQRLEEVRSTTVWSE